MGWQQYVTALLQAGQTIINGKGIFAYSPSPATGNLAASVAGLATSNEGQGNFVEQGVWVYTIPGDVTGFGLAMSGTTGNLNYQTAPGTIGSVLSYDGTNANFSGASGGQTNLGTASAGSLVNLEGAKIQVTLPSGFAGFVTPGQADAATFTNTNSTTAVAITKSWTIPANDSTTAGTTYEVEVPFNGTSKGQTVQWGVLLDTTSRAGTTIGPAFFSLGTAFDGTVKGRLRIVTPGGVGTGLADFSVTGGVGVSGTRSSGTNNNDAYLSALQTSVAHNTTVSHTISVYAVFGAAAAGQVCSGHGSVFTRSGQ